MKLIILLLGLGIMIGAMIITWRNETILEKKQRLYVLKHIEEISGGDLNKAKEYADLLVWYDGIMFKGNERDEIEEIDIYAETEKHKIEIPFN